MPEIIIDAAKAERIIAQILRDDAKLLPAKANEIAATIARRLNTSMAAPVNQPLQGHRIIPSSPPIGSDFTQAVRKKVGNVDDSLAYDLWGLVFERGRDLPPNVADVLR